MTLTAKEWGTLEPDLFKEALQEAPEHIRPALLRTRFRYNKREFCRYCWPERFDLAFNELHDDLFSMADVEPWDTRGKPDTLDAIAAPRGFGKSSIISFALIAHAIVYDLEAYIVLMSSGQRLARAFSLNLLGQFRSETIHDERRFTRLYGPFRVTGGKDEWQVAVRDNKPVGILTASFGQDVRGAQHPTRGIRPTLVVLDDAEKKDRVRNPDQRDIWQAILDRDILKLTDRKRGMSVRFVGTVLHPDSILARREADPGWRFRRYKAIIAWPTRQDLWDRCKKIWTNLRLGLKRHAAARAFYESKKDEMNEGVELLDPDAMDIFQLYEIIWGQGMGAFLQEMQNEPRDPTTQVFFPERWSWFTLQTDRDGRYLQVEGDDPRKVYLNELRFKFLRWDPAKGIVTGDYAAIAAVGKDKWGYKYVLRVWMQKRVPSIQLDALWGLAETFDIRRGSVEGNGFQEFAAAPFYTQKRQRREAGLYHALELDSDPSVGNKNDRIATLEPECDNGWLCFSRDIPVEVIGQFEEFPNATHDDGPDCVQGASAALGVAGSIGMVSE